MSRTLHLTLKKKWFDMIASGEKKEEYREIKTYWVNRLVESYDVDTGESLMKFGKEGDAVIFRNGYAAASPVIKLDLIEIAIGTGNPAWGAIPGKIYFVIKLGEINP